MINLDREIDAAKIIDIKIVLSRLRDDFHLRIK